MIKLLQAVLLVSILPLITSSSAAAASQKHDSSIWVTAYYPVWEQKSNLPADKVDYTAFTNLIQLSVMPTTSGGIVQSGWNAVTPAISQAFKESPQ